MFETIEWIFLIIIFVLISVLVDYGLKRKVKNEGIQVLITLVAMTAAGILFLLATKPNLTFKGYLVRTFGLILIVAMIFSAQWELKSWLREKFRVYKKRT